MVLKLPAPLPCVYSRFENDVKMYGTQTRQNRPGSQHPFENDVKMYGTQTSAASIAA